MGKKKTNAAVDENCDRWLSTRNKRKISPPRHHGRSGGHRAARRTPIQPVNRLHLLGLMENEPQQQHHLSTVTHQTSILRFFHHRLPPLPATGSTAGSTVTRSNVPSPPPPSPPPPRPEEQPRLSLPHVDGSRGITEQGETTLVTSPARRVVVVSPTFHTVLEGVLHDVSDSASTHMTATHSDSTHMTATDSDSTHMTATNSDSTHMTATDSDSTHMTATDSDSTHMTATDSDSTHMTATDSDSTHMTATDSDSTHMMATDSDSTHMTATDSDSTHMTATRGGTLAACQPEEERETEVPCVANSDTDNSDSCKSQEGTPQESALPVEPQQEKQAPGGGSAAAYLEGDAAFDDSLCTPAFLRGEHSGDSFDSQLAGETPTEKLDLHTDYSSIFTLTFDSCSQDTLPLEVSDEVGDEEVGDEEVGDKEDMLRIDTDETCSSWVTGHSLHVPMATGVDGVHGEITKEAGSLGLSACMLSLNFQSSQGSDSDGCTWLKEKSSMELNLYGNMSSQESLNLNCDNLGSERPGKSDTGEILVTPKTDKTYLTMECWDTL